MDKLLYWFNMLLANARARLRSHVTWFYNLIGSSYILAGDKWLVRYLPDPFSNFFVGGAGARE